MIRLLLVLSIIVARLLFRSCLELVVEKLALRQQLAVFKQKRSRCRLVPADWIFWVFLRRAWRHWGSCLILVEPDTVVGFNQAQLRRLLADYVTYYHQDRCHLALGKDAPNGRGVSSKPSPEACVVAPPRVGGLQYRYEWCQAA
jgi:hypothetical protein